MLSAKKLSELLVALHSAPLEETNWQIFLNGLCEATLAAHGGCLAIDLKRGLPKILAVGGLRFNPEVQERYNQHYSQLDPYSQPFRLKAGACAVMGEELVQRDELENTEFYNDFLVRSGMHHGTMIPGAITSKRLELVSIWRGPEQGPFDRDSQQLFELLLPHLQSALQVRHVLEVSRTRALRAEATLDATPTASFILNTSGRVVYMNQAAESLARSQHGLGVLNNRLVAAVPEAQARLQGMIASAAIAGSGGISTPHAAIALPQPSGKRPLHALIFPMRLPVATAAPAHVLVLVTDPEAAVSFSASILSALFGLTRSEVEIANGLLAGLSIEEIANLRSVTAGTLRGQMKTIFQKTDTRRQGELIRLLMSLPQNASENN